MIGYHNSFNFVESTFFKGVFSYFLEKQYFNFFLSFALSRGSFVVFELPAQIFEELCVYLSGQAKFPNVYLAENKARPAFNYLEAHEGDMIFCNLHSFFDKTMVSELRFLDMTKTLNSKNLSFIGIIKEDAMFDFTLNDVRSRFLSASHLRFGGEAELDFFTVASDFLSKNGIKVEPAALKFMLGNIERDILSFSIFIEELVRFIESTKKPANRKNFEVIYEKYKERKAALPAN